MKPVRRIGPEALESIFDHSADGMLFTAPDGTILAANPAACAMLGRTEDEICELSRQGLADPTDERWGPGIRQRQETGQFIGELRMLRADGSALIADVTSNVFTDGDGNVRASVIFRDAADRIVVIEARERLAAEREVVKHLERVARDLHDTVIQRLFALGMSLQAVYPSATGSVADRIAAAVDGLDDIIRDIRATIFALHHRHGGLDSLRAEVEALVDDAAENLGFRPSVGFEGPVDTLVDAESAHHVRAVLREALSNIVRHAEATQVQIVVAADGDLVLTVADDGVGLEPGHPAGDGDGDGGRDGDGDGGQGLRNMRERARAMGGHFRTSANLPRGTVLEWRMPLRARDSEPQSA